MIPADVAVPMNPFWARSSFARYCRYSFLGIPDKENSSSSLVHDASSLSVALYEKKMPNNRGRPATQRGT